MTKTEILKIRLSQVEAEKKPAFAKENSTYIDGELLFQANIMSEKNFRLVHDNNSVLTLFEGTDKNQTITIHNVKEFKTKQMTLNRIEALKLEYTPEDDVGKEEEPGKL